MLVIQTELIMKDEKTLRDEFAISAMQALIPLYVERGKGCDTYSNPIDSLFHKSAKKPHREIAEVAYNLADAMIEKREIV